MLKIYLLLFALSVPGFGMHEKLLGQANEFKEGDVAVGVAAKNNAERMKAREQLSHLKISDIHENPVYEDEQQALIWQDTDPKIYKKIKNWTLGELKTFLLTQSESNIKQIMPGLDSDVIASVVKLMSNDELIKVGQTVFNPIPNSKVGSKGYMGARIQPNSPTDNPEDIAWEVFNGFSYAVGDVLLGNNPVDSTPASVFRVESILKDIIETFRLQKILAWSVLAHVDVQNTVEKQHPGSTDLFFQSIGGVADANQTLGISVKKMMNYAKKRNGLRHGFYFETGQGADFTNKHGHGFDMVIHESRKYGLARALKRQTAWVIVNDVAGFIGPEVFRTKEQLVRTCLEDIVMGKLHGLTIGLDICSTLHMSISLDDLEWCQNQIMPANPAYLMALPTRNDPMLSYLTTSFRDHVRIREKFNYKVNDDMWDFFKKLQVIDQEGKPTEHFGDPVWVYMQYQIKKGDKRPETEIYAEGLKKAQAVESRGVALDRGQPGLEAQTRALYDDAKKSIWMEFPPEFIQSIPNKIILKTLSKD
ncbi:MAG: ethanolamine ammonia-lyase subunit EutB, partial [Myxococcaceae bacterium]